MALLNTRIYGALHSDYKGSATKLELYSKHRLILFTVNRKSIFRGCAAHRHHIAELCLPDMLCGERGESAAAKRVRHPVHGQIIVAGVVHMPVEIDAAIGDKEVGDGIGRRFAQPPGKRQLIAGDNFLNIDVVFLRKDDPAGLIVDQHP